MEVTLIDQIRIDFITKYVFNSLHTGVSLIELVKEAKEAWAEILKP